MDIKNIIWRYPVEIIFAASLASPSDAEVTEPALLGFPTGE
jgi:hypothetical protein